MNVNYQMVAPYLTPLSNTAIAGIQNARARFDMQKEAARSQANADRAFAFQQAQAKQTWDRQRQQDVIDAERYRQAWDAGAPQREAGIIDLEAKKRNEAVKKMLFDVMSGRIDAARGTPLGESYAGFYPEGKTPQEIMQTFAPLVGIKLESEVSPNYQRKTRQWVDPETGFTMAQDYDFDPKSRQSLPSGSARVVDRNQKLPTAKRPLTPTEMRDKVFSYSTFKQKNGTSVPVKMDPEDLKALNEEFASSGYGVVEVAPPDVRGRFDWIPGYEAQMVPSDDPPTYQIVKLGGVPGASATGQPPVQVEPGGANGQAYEPRGYSPPEDDVMSDADGVTAEQVRDAISTEQGREAIINAMISAGHTPDQIKYQMRYLLQTFGTPQPKQQTETPTVIRRPDDTGRRMSHNNIEHVKLDGNFLWINGVRYTTPDRFINLWGQKTDVLSLPEGSPQRQKYLQFVKKMESIGVDAINGRKINEEM